MRNLAVSHNVYFTTQYLCTFTGCGLSELYDYIHRFKFIAIYWCQIAFLAAPYLNLFCKQFYPNVYGTNTELELGDLYLLIVGLVRYAQIYILCRSALLGGESRKNLLEIGDGIAYWAPGVEQEIVSLVGRNVEIECCIFNL